MKADIAEQVRALFELGELRAVTWLAFAHVQTLTSDGALDGLDADIVAYGAEAACRIWRWDIGSVLLPTVDRLLFAATSGELVLAEDALEMLNLNRPTLAQ
jgi:hypothetical protein